MAPAVHDLDLSGEGRTLHLASAGAGPDIVLIHGAMTTHADWMGQLFDGLAQRGRVLAVDRPGHGKSLRNRFEAAPVEQARHIREGLQQLGVRRPLLVGHSFGAMVASAWASIFPEDVSGLMLISPIAFQELRPLEHPLFGPRAFPVLGPVLSQLADLTIDPAMLPLIQKIMFAPREPPADWLARYPIEQILSPTAMVAEGEDAAVMFPGSPTGLVNYLAIKAPVRMLIGQMDHVVYPIRHARGLAWLLPRARLVPQRDAGHMVHHAAPDAVFAAVDELLSMDQELASERI